MNALPYVSEASYNKKIGGEGQQLSSHMGIEYD